MLLSPISEVIGCFLLLESGKAFGLRGMAREGGVGGRRVRSLLRGADLFGVVVVDDVAVTPNRFSVEVLHELAE